MQEKNGSSRLRIVLTTKPLRGVPCHHALRSMAFLESVYSRSFHSLVPSNFDGSLEPAWLRGDSNQPQYIRRHEPLGLLLEKLCKSFVYQNAPASDTIAASKRTHSLSNACHLDFVWIRFFSASRGNLVEVCPAGCSLGLFTEAPRKNGRGKMALVAVVSVPADIRPLAVDGSRRTFTCGRCGFGTSAPLLAKASPM